MAFDQARQRRQTSVQSTSQLRASLRWAAQLLALSDPAWLDAVPD